MDCEGCEAQVILGPERERLRAFEHIVFETHPYITGVSNEKLLTPLKELGFECRLHIIGSPELGLNVYYCRNSMPKTGLTECFEEENAIIDAGPGRYKQRNVSLLRSTSQ
jgi:hypothetical protein